MPLQLKTVEPARGLRWLGDAVRLVMRRPLPFALMFSTYLSVAMLLAMVPLAGPVLALATVPLLSLGFMIAAQSALLDGPVHPRQFIEPLRGEPERRRTLLALCAVYGVASSLAMVAFYWVAADAIAKLEALPNGTTITSAELAAIMSDPSLAQGQLLLLVLVSLLSIPFWHAPALVHWGGQSLGQSLFSSTLGLWRTKAAFLVFCLGCAGFGFLLVLGSVVLVTALGGAMAATVLVLVAWLLYWTVFYVSLLFAFNDTFGSARSSQPEPPLQA